MPLLKTRRHVGYLLLAFAWAVSLGFVLPWLMSAPSTLAVLLGIAILLALLLITVQVVPAPSTLTKEETE